MIKRLLFLSLFVVLTGCSSEEDNSEPPAELVDFTASAELTRVWDVSVGDGVEQQYLKLYPLVLEDRLIVADRNGVVMAVRLEDGEVLWRKQLDIIVSSGVGGNGDYHLLTSRDGEVISLDAKGAIIWRNDLSSEVLAPAVIAKNRAILRSIDGQFTALDIKTGKQLWNYKRQVPALSLRGNSQPLVDGSSIFSGLDNGRLVVLHAADGRSLLDIAIAVPSGRSELERMVDIDGDAALDDNLLFMGSYQGRLVALDVRRGRLQWSRKLSTSTGLAISDSAVYVSDARDHVWSLDRSNGATLWKQEKLQARQLTRPVVMGDVMLVADFEGYVHVISQYDGHFMARVEVADSGILVPPVVRGDRIYVMTRDGDLVAYQYKKS